MKPFSLFALTAITVLLGCTTSAIAQTTRTNAQVKEEIRTVIDAYATLGDEKKIAEQIKLFTPDANYKVFMNGSLVANITGARNIETEFNGHAAQVKTYFTLNGQLNVQVNGNNASGVSFTQIKMVRTSEGKDTLTDYSVRYDDKYIFQNGTWLIKERVANFIIVEARPLKN